ncbi:MAG: heavy metal translocating P-type ATPase metal-binding domain-containing protein, partial [Myxococcota bacterium]
MTASAVACPACDHCGLPVPSGRFDPKASHQFCCSGCQTVFEVIHAGGFESFYALRDRLPRRQAPSRRSFEEFDDPAFMSKHAQVRDDELASTELYLEGVHCSACLWLIEKSMAAVQGVTEAKLNFAQSRLSLTWCPSERPLSAIAERLAALGYTPHPVSAGAPHIQRKEERRALMRLGVAGAVAGNVMLLAFALYGGDASGMDAAHRQLFRYMSLIVSIPSVVFAAAPFFRGAWAGLRVGVLHMDLPISIGIVAGFGGGLVNTLRDVGEIYFDSVTALIFLLLVGRLLQRRQQRRASESSELLYALAPSSAHRIDAAGQISRVPLEAIEAGDRLHVPAGDRIATDGVVERGRSAVDVSLLSGESMPVAVRDNDRVWGGTTNLQSALVVRATHTVQASRVGKIAQMI